MDKENAMKLFGNISVNPDSFRIPYKPLFLDDNDLYKPRLYCGIFEEAIDSNVVYVYMSKTEGCESAE